MKTRTRSYRRHKQASKLRRRIKLYGYWGWGSNSTEDFRKEVMEGKYNWIRTTGRPCNCYSCQMRTYKRLQQSQLKRIIDDQLQDTVLVV